MIDYEVLVQTLADWKAGARPAAPARPIPTHVAETPSAAQPEMVEEIESGVLDMGEGEAEVDVDAADADPGEGEVEWSEEDEQ